MGERISLLVMLSGVALGLYWLGILHRGVRTAGTGYESLKNHRMACTSPVEIAWLQVFRKGAVGLDQSRPDRFIACSGRAPKTLIRSARLIPTEVKYALESNNICSVDDCLHGSECTGLPLSRCKDRENHLQRCALHGWKADRSASDRRRTNAQRRTGGHCATTQSTCSGAGSHAAAAAAAASVTAPTSPFYSSICYVV